MLFPPGIRADENKDETYGQKFLAVGPGGKLNIYGKYKRSWTRLTKHLQPYEKPEAALHKPRKPMGLAVIEMDPNTGKRRRDSQPLKSLDKFTEALDKIDDGRKTFFFLLPLD